MLFLIYWEFNEDMSVEDRIEISRKLTEEGLFPPEDAEVLRWDGTPDGWGIAVVEADDFKSVNTALNLWRSSGTPVFEETKTAPAAPVEEIIPQLAALLERLE